jgi:ADP-ribosylglycohydrolase
LAVAKPLLCEERDHHETLRAIELAEDLAGRNVSPEKAITRLGQGWIAEEALAISLYCALVAPDFRHGVILAVNHDGDSDSTGSITGNLLGTRYGVNAIPQQWLEPLELREVIAEIAEDLHDCIEWPLSPFGSDPEQRDRIWRKYPGY